MEHVNTEDFQNPLACSGNAKAEGSIQMLK